MLQTSHSYARKRDTDAILNGFKADDMKRLVGRAQLFPNHLLAITAKDDSRAEAKTDVIIGYIDKLSRTDFSLLAAHSPSPPSTYLNPLHCQHTRSFCTAITIP